MNILSSKSIQSCIDEIEKYKKDLVWKCEKFVARLAEVGINVAKMNVNGSLGAYITFRIETDPNTTGCTALAIASSGTIESSWIINDSTNEVKTVDISPLLMIEFGSGSKAVNNTSLPYGRGTFPNQTHAMKGYWNYKGLDGKWHRSSGVAPQQPMQKALQEMLSNIETVAREVFGGNP